MDIFENPKGFVARDHNGKEVMIEGVDYNMTITKTHEENPGMTPTTFTVNTQDKEEAGRLLQLSGLDEPSVAGVTPAAPMPGEDPAMGDAMVSTPDMKGDNMNPMSELEQLRRRAGIGGVGPTADVAMEAEEIDAEIEEVVEVVEEGDMMKLYRDMLDGKELSESALDKIKQRYQHRQARKDGDHNDRIERRIADKPGALDKVAEKSKARMDAGDEMVCDQDIDPTDNDDCCGDDAYMQDLETQNFQAAIKQALANCSDPERCSQLQAMLDGGQPVLADSDAVISGDEENKCPTCGNGHGTGYTASMQQEDEFDAVEDDMMDPHVCPKCSGETIDEYGDPCRLCKGTGENPMANKPKAPVIPDEEYDDADQFFNPQDDDEIRQIMGEEDEFMEEIDSRLAALRGED